MAPYLFGKVLHFRFETASFNASAGVKIIFLNGIDGYDEKNQISKVKLSEIMVKAGFGAKLSTARVGWEYWSNPGDGFFDDKLELLVQARLSGEALSLSKNENPNANAQSAEYYKNLGNKYLQKIYDGTADSEEARHVYSVVRDFAAYVSQEILINKNQIIVVSHSQGNFFAEAVAAYLTVAKTTLENKQFDTSLRFVGVASVAASTPQYRYISAYEDKALFAHIASTALIGNFSILPFNAKFCSNINILCAANIELTIDPTIHGFQETYTSELVDQNTGQPIYKILAKHVNDSFDELIASSTPFSGDYTAQKIEGTSIDPSITLFTGAGAGGLSNAQLAPNDAGVAYGYANYTQGGQTKFGVFFLNQPGGLWYLATDSSQSYTSSSLVGVNDLGQAIIQDTDTRTLPAVTRYSYVSKANDGSLFRFTLNVPPGVTLRGILNNGNIVGVKDYDTVLYDKTMNPIATIYGNVFLRFGLDGTSDASGYDTTAEVYKRVRFTDGTVQTLPCNSGWTNLALLKPATGRNCSQITALSGNGVVAGLYYSADGSQGVYKFSKAGFEEIPISTQYFGYGTGANTLSPPRPLGISNAGDILLSPIYSDENAQTCVGGPFLLSGSTLIDLKKYIPGGSCFNIQASISGGGRIFVSSQAQGYSGYLVKN